MLGAHSTPLYWAHALVYVASSWPHSISYIGKLRSGTLCGVTQLMCRQRAVWLYSRGKDLSYGTRGPGQGNTRMLATAGLLLSHFPLPLTDQLVTFRAWPLADSFCSFKTQQPGVLPRSLEDHPQSSSGVKVWKACFS